MILKTLAIPLMVVAVGVAAVLAACPQSQTRLVPAAVSPRSAANTGVDGEVVRLESQLQREVPVLLIDRPDAQSTWITRTQSAIAASRFVIRRPQLVVVVDRNRRVQQMRIVLALEAGPWRDLGGSRVSTGQTGRRDYYLTPTGVFLHTDAILDWRAEGTYNENHIRGLGVRGMRVWDFGWQPAAKGWGNGEEGEIRLLMHATDPDYLQRLLGHPASKGCVRVPDAMNRFLDRHGVLDADYERAAKTDPRFAALLLPDRTPTPLAGEALVIIDSAETAPIAAGDPKSAQPASPVSAGRAMGVARLAKAGRLRGCS